MLRSLVVILAFLGLSGCVFQGDRGGESAQQNQQTQNKESGKEETKPKEESKPSEESKPKADSTPVMPPSAANVVSIKRQEINVPFEYPGRVKSSQQVMVSARVSGTILAKHFVEGEFVKEGEILYTIDPVLFEASVEQAKAQLDVARAQLLQTDREWKRVKSLFEEGVASEKERDDALATYTIALASVNVAKASLKKAEIDLGYTSVRAPISGVAGKSLKDVGALVGGADPTLLVMTRLSPVYVEFAIADSQNLASLFKNRKDGGDQIPLEAVVHLGNGIIHEQKGEVDFIDRVIDESTGSLKARATFPNSGDSLLLPGQFVRIEVKGLLKANGFLVPQQAVFQVAQGPFVYVVQKGKAVVKPIKIEQAFGHDFIVSWGLEDGDQVVINNLMKIRPGAPVQIDGGR